MLWKHRTSKSFQNGNIINLDPRFKRLISYTAPLTLLQFINFGMQSSPRVSGVVIYSFIVAILPHALLLAGPYRVNCTLQNDDPLTETPQHCMTEEAQQSHKSLRSSGIFNERIVSPIDTGKLRMSESQPLPGKRAGASGDGWESTVGPHRCLHQRQPSQHVIKYFTTNTVFMSSTDLHNPNEDAWRYNTVDLASGAAHADVVEACNGQATVFSSIQEALLLPPHENVGILPQVPTPVRRHRTFVSERAHCLSVKDCSNLDVELHAFNACMRLN